MIMLCSGRVRKHTTSKWISLLFIPLFLMRFIILAPSLYYNNYAGNHHNVIKNNAQLHNGTYGTAVVMGERLADKWSSVMFYYNIASWVPSFVFIPPLHLPFTVVETTLTVYVSSVTHRQSGYIPHNKRDCYTSKTFLMQPPPGTNESFFAAAARLNTTVTTPADMCLSFVKEWQFGVAMCFLYAFMSLLGIILLLGSIGDAKKQGTSLWDMLKDLGADLLLCITFPLTCLLIAIMMMLYAIPWGLFRCLPLSVKTPVRSARRYTFKTGLGVEQNTHILLTELKSALTRPKKPTERYQGGAGTHTQLAQFLGVYDVLIIVAKHLHYTDIANLASVSKSVRESVLPSNDLARRLLIFKLYTCDADSKRSCWTCTKQICDECFYLSRIPQETALYHMENCVPYCKRCFRVHVVNREQGLNQRFKSRNCGCGPSTAPPKNPVWRFLFRSFYSRKPRTLQLKSRLICSHCKMTTAEKLLSSKETATKSMLKKGLKSNGEEWTTCARTDCSRNLGMGPRFWVCPNRSCRKECTNTLHQAWGRQVDDSSVGDQTV